ncbi:MAG: cysteine desulfurase NifS [Kiritimatiellaeota bacterium]|nr:cysteine desulfurase NifS [Kiritimatiellota bacterium]
MKTIYMDNNATTAIAPEVVAALTPFLTDQYFNPSSAYEQARPISAALNNARREVAALLGGVTPDQITFTSCATESNNWAIGGVARAQPQRRHILTTAVEHPAVLEVCKDLARQGYEVTFLPVDRSGQLDRDAYIRALRPDTLLVTIMHANNETGVLFPVAELARIAHETNPAIVFHTDATQAIGKIPVDLTAEFEQVDLLSFSGHKLHAPKGVGALYSKRGTPIRPLLIGGHQENNRRAGTENVPYIVALGEACRLAALHLADVDRIRGLRNKLEAALVQRIPYLEVNGRDAPRLPNTLNLACHYIEGESILYQLNEHGICASSGSACTSGSLEPSHVLKAMHVPFTAMHGSVRFSLSRYTTATEVNRVIEVFPEVVASLRRISPYWDAARDAPRPTAPHEPPPQP